MESREESLPECGRLFFIADGPIVAPESIALYRNEKDAREEPLEHADDPDYMARRLAAVSTALVALSALGILYHNAV